MRATVDAIIDRIEADDETCHAGSPRGLSEVNCMVPVGVVERILYEVLERTPTTEDRE